MENIDDEADDAGIHFVKTTDTAFAKSLGIHTFPTVVYFEDSEPIVYNGERAGRGPCRTVAAPRRWVVAPMGKGRWCAMGAGGSKGTLGVEVGLTSVCSKPGWVAG